MFAKSKKFAIPLVALLVASIAVEAAPAGNVPFPQVCQCTISADTQVVDRSQVACALVGQVNGAVWSAAKGLCEVGTQTAHDSFIDDCRTITFNVSTSEPDHPNVYHGLGDCFQDVNVPQSCVCANPSGVNTTAQTQRACTLVGNTGTMVGDKCVVSTQAQYTGFGLVCSSQYQDSKAICSA